MKHKAAHAKLLTECKHAYANAGMKWQRRKTSRQSFDVDHPRAMNWLNREVLGCYNGQATPQFKTRRTNCARKMQIAESAIGCFYFGEMSRKRAFKIYYAERGFKDHHAANLRRSAERGRLPGATQVQQFRAQREYGKEWQLGSGT